MKTLIELNILYLLQYIYYKCIAKELHKKNVSLKEFIYRLRSYIHRHSILLLKSNFFLSKNFLFISIANYKIEQIFEN